MNKKKTRILTVIIAATLLVWYFFPRNFEHAMPRGFDPEEMLGVDALLNSPFGEEETRTVSLTPEDQVYGELVALLDRENYFQLFRGGQPKTITLDYTVLLCFYKEGQDYCMNFTGDDVIDFYGTGSDRKGFRSTGGVEFQKEIQDLLIQQIPENSLTER